MRRETAYRLAGRNHEHGCDATELDRQRDILLDGATPEQLQTALEGLSQVPGLQVSLGEKPGVLHLSYKLNEHCLEEVETLLEAAGLHLSHSLFEQFKRQIVHFCEETQRRNLASPQRLIKQSSEVYVQAWEQHPHGDKDETPVELREYK